MQFLGIQTNRQANLYAIDEIDEEFGARAVAKPKSLGQRPQVRNVVAGGGGQITLSF